MQKMRERWSCRLREGEVKEQVSGKSGFESNEK